MNDNQDISEEFLHLIGENQRIIFKICNSYCYNKDNRKDLAQEIIYQLWKSYGSFNAEYKFSTWMYRIALNVAISFYRKENKSLNTVSLDEDFINIDTSEDISGETGRNINMLQRFINELKELDRALMILYLEEKNYREIGEILGITESNAGTKINRIKEKLKQKFSNLKDK